MKKESQKNFKYYIPSKGILLKRKGKKMAKAKLGSGTRFKELTKKLSAKGAKNPKALAASIGSKKYGSAKMSSLASAGKRRAS